MSNKNLPFYIAKSKISGKGSFASRNIKTGEIINIIGGIVRTEKEVDNLIEKGELRMDDDFQIDEDKFLIVQCDSYFINHSCNPDAGIKNVKQIVAIKDIGGGEEITIDYSTISAPSKNGTKFRNERWFMDCTCGSENCRKKSGLSELCQNKLWKIT